MKIDQEKPVNHVLIIGINSGIGEALAARYLSEGAKVAGTYRKTRSKTIESLPDIETFALDVADPASVELFCEQLQEVGFRWNLIVFSVGTLEPIGEFHKLNYDQWEASFSTNFFGQLRLLSGLRDLAQPDASVIFFTGGAPGGVLPRFSAYSVAKIGLTKMVEYLDEEDADVKYAIVGPGWVNTRIHQQTLNAGENAGDNLKRTRSFLLKGEQGTSFEDIYKCINWIVAKNKRQVGGRNFSVVWDAWGKREGSNELESRMLQDENLFKLRRFEG